MQCDIEGVGDGILGVVTKRATLARLGWAGVTAGITNTASAGAADGIAGAPARNLSALVAVG